MPLQRRRSHEQRHPISLTSSRASSPTSGDRLSSHPRNQGQATPPVNPDPAHPMPAQPKDKKRHIFPRFGKKKTSSSRLPSATQSSAVLPTTTSVVNPRKRPKEYEHSVGPHPLEVGGVLEDSRGMSHYHTNNLSPTDERKRSAGSQTTRKLREKSEGSLSHSGSDMELDQNFGSMDDIVNRSYHVQTSNYVEANKENKAAEWAPPDSWAVQPAVLTGTATPSLAEDEEQSDFDTLSLVEQEPWDVPRRDFCIRIFRPDNTFGTLIVPLTITTHELIRKLADKFFLQDLSKYTLLLRRRYLERALLPDERPIQIQKHLLEQMGYTDQDKIEDVGREDNSYLLRFVFGPNLTSKIQEEDMRHDSFRHVVMSGFNLPTVPIFLYKYARSIESLDFSRNLLMEIPVDFIRDCDSLTSLSLAGNEYQALPRSIRDIHALVRLDISSNRLRDLNKAGLERLEFLQVLTAFNNRLESIPASFSFLQRLTHLSISNNMLIEFPVAICNITTLVYLDISFNRIPSFPPQIANLQRLSEIYAIANCLTGDLPRYFEKLVSLRVLDVRQNLITELSAIKDLHNLETIEVDYNAINLVHYEFKYLRELKMSKNHLTHFSLGYCRMPDDIARNPKLFINGGPCALTSICLSSCKLTSLAKDLFYDLPLLEYLVLDGNTLASLPESIGELTRLVRLSVQSNTLTSLPSEIGKLAYLKTLCVQKNNLKELPREIWLCPALQTLNCSSNLLELLPEPYTLPSTNMNPSSTSVRNADKGKMNNIELAGLNAGQGTVPDVPGPPAINCQPLPYNPPLSLSTNSKITSEPGTDEPPGSAHPLPNFNPPSFFASPRNHPPPLSLSLRHLLLGDNRLTDDVWTPLSYFLELRTLNLSFNYLYEIPSERLCHQHLYELYLSGNQLTSLPADDIEKLNYLRVLAVNGNKLQTLPTEVGKLRKLLVVDVGNNLLKYNISNLEYDWNWNSNPGLKYLNLSGNKRFEIKKPVPNYHHPNDINMSHFNSLTRLRMLGLMDITIQGRLTPEESHDKRVRTSPTEVNGMGYGVADWLGPNDHFTTWDLVMPRFRNNDDECLFGLFDGQCTSKVEDNPSLFDANQSTRSGSKLAKYLNDNWTRHFINELMKAKNDDTTVSALRRTFLVLEKEYGSRIVDEPNIGASCVLCFFSGKMLYVANVGDSMAVISRSNGQAFEITQKHIPLNPNEASRIRAAGGFVSNSGKLNGKLSVSRSFGYYGLIPIVNANPFISEIELTENDEFLIIASSGLWDCMTYQAAVDVARTEKGDPMAAAQKLRDFAITYGADSNITVMVICIDDLFDKRDKRLRHGLMNHGATRSPEVSNLLLDDGTSQTKTKRRAKDAGPGDSTLARLEREVAPPTNKVALVFTDIKRSTNLWETVPEDMRSAIKIHDAIMRRALRMVGGYEVKTEGDAFMVCFQNVTSALLWCLTVQLQLLEADWPTSILEKEEGRPVEKDGVVIYRGLSVRMGIHFGSPVLELNPVTGRMDYFGPVVNKASRICAKADGGEIFVSSEVISALSHVPGILHAVTISTNPLALEKAANDLSIARDVQQLKHLGFHVVELGEQRLKGLETPEVLSLVYPKSLQGRVALEKSVIMTTDPALLGTLEPFIPGRTRPRKVDEVDTTVTTASASPEEESTYLTPGSAPVSPPKDNVLRVIEPTFVSALHNLAMRLERITTGTVSASQSTSAYSRTDTFRPRTTFAQSFEQHMFHDASDEDLLILMDNFVTRIENAASALYLQKVGRFANVLERLGEAIELDPMHILRALQMYAEVSGLSDQPWGA